MLLFNFEDFFIPLFVGFLLDLLLGDPICLPHPIRFFGSSIAFLDNRLNKNNARKIKGMLMTLFLVLAVFYIFYLLVELSKLFSFGYFIVCGISVFYGIANRNLVEEVLRVEFSLQKEGIEFARRKLSSIVGRDTQHLNDTQIRKALLETLSENLSDGVIAPMFFYAIGGIPLMFAYKMVNTLDSMIGYKNEKYHEFGFFAAKLDDVLNYIPSRLTALIMVLISFSGRGFLFIFKYGNKHSSPNSGYPEAALAGILNVRLGGESTYGGILFKKPHIGNQERNIFSKDIYKAVTINLFSACLFLFCLGLISFLFCFIY